MKQFYDYLTHHSIFINLKQILIKFVPKHSKVLRKVFHDKFLNVYQFGQDL
jgi:hypothetical protein